MQLCHHVSKTWWQSWSRLSTVLHACRETQEEVELEQAEQDINRIFRPTQHFTPSSLLVVTWVNVGAYFQQFDAVSLPWAHQGFLYLCQSLIFIALILLIKEAVRLCWHENTTMCYITQAVCVCVVCAMIASLTVTASLTLRKLIYNLLKLIYNKLLNQVYLLGFEALCANYV